MRSDRPSRNAVLLVLVFVVSYRSLWGAEPTGEQAREWLHSLMKPWSQQTGLQFAGEGCQRLQTAFWSLSRRQSQPVLEAPETSHRLLHLTTGEAFPVELYELDEVAVEFRLANSSSRYRIPLDFVAKISRFDNRWDVWSSPLGGPSVHWHAETPASVSAGELELWWADHGGSALSLELLFDGSLPLRWEVASSSQAKPSLVLPESWNVTSRQPAGVAGFRTGPMVFRWTETDWSWVVDGVVRMGGQRPPGGLVQISGRTSSPTTTAGRLFLRRNLTSEETQNTKSLAESRGVDNSWQDSIATMGGTRLYGRLVMATGVDAALSSQVGTATIPWQDIWEIRLARRPDGQTIPGALAGRIVQGIDVQSPGSDIRRWVFAVSGTEDGRSILHPLLGRFPRASIPVLSAREFTGEWHWLFPALVQVGGRVRTDLPESQARETKLSGEWVLSDRLSLFPTRCTLRFRVEVAEMTPTEPGLSPAGQRPSALSDNASLWEVLINGETIGCLNDQLRARPPRFAPQVIALEIPREVLLRGNNRWEIRPRASGSGTQQDRVCLGRIAFEVK